MPVHEDTQIYIQTHVSYPNTSQHWGTPARKLVTLPAPPGRQFHLPPIPQGKLFQCW